jgi:glucokinase
LEVLAGCFAVAGPVDDKRVEMANADLVVDAEQIKNETCLDTVHLINDFDALGYAINVLDPEDWQEVQEGVEEDEKRIAVIGAGTGLGKNLMVYDKHIETYLPQSSEGGHADLPLTSQEELDLADSIKYRHDIESEVAYEDVLSGKGLKNIYSYFRKTQHQEEVEMTPKQISEKKESNACLNKTFEKFIEFYARCCRNYALDTLPENGLYIVGGIAAKNPDEFDQRFVEEFRNASPQFHDLLSQIPIRVVTNYDISLKGAAHALEMEKEEK